MRRRCLASSSAPDRPVLFSLSGSSTIIAPYRDGAGKIVGVLGVIGPTRLNYARVIPTVDYAARIVSRLLGG